MERGSQFNFIRTRTFGALVLSYLAVSCFQAGREVERPAEANASLLDPISWIAAPVDDFAETAGLVDKPIETQPEH